MQTDIPVKDVMTRDVCTIKKDAKIDELARKLIEYGVGSAVVVDSERPIGIVTEKDLIAKVVARNKKPSEVLVSEIMSTPLITITPRTSLRDAAKIMIKMGIRRLPVIDNTGKLVGIITDNDILSVSLDLGEFAALITESSTGYSVEEEFSGICEKCGKYTDKLKNVDGMNVCEECEED